MTPALRPPRTAERGQALTELVLLLPAFAGILLVFTFLAYLSVCRLALIQLTRDSALYLARESSLWIGPPAEQLQAVRELAAQRKLLDPQAIEVSLEPLELPLQGGSPSLLQSAMNTGSLKMVRSMLLGKRLTLRWRLRFQGLAGLVFPNGLQLRESVALQGDAWDFGNGRDWKKIFDSVFSSLF